MNTTIEPFGAVVRKPIVARKTSAAVLDEVKRVAAIESPEAPRGWHRRVIEVSPGHSIFDSEEADAQRWRDLRRMIVDAPAQDGRLRMVAFSVDDRVKCAAVVLLSEEIDWLNEKNKRCGRGSCRHLRAAHGVACEPICQVPGCVCGRFQEHA